MKAKDITDQAKQLLQTGKDFCQDMQAESFKEKMKRLWRERKEIKMETQVLIAELLTDCSAIIDEAKDRVYNFKRMMDKRWDEAPPEDPK